MMQDTYSGFLLKSGRVVQFYSFETNLNKCGQM